MEEFLVGTLWFLLCLVTLIYVSVTRRPLIGKLKQSRLYLLLEEWFLYFATTGFSPPHFEIPGQARIHDKRGSTFVRKFFGKTVVFTSDPLNVKAVWSSNFADWGVEELRLSTLGQITGHSFDVLDGKPWQRSLDVTKLFLKKGAQPVDLLYLEQCLTKAIGRIPDEPAPLEMATVLSDMYFESAYKYYTNDSIDGELLSLLGVKDVGEIRSRLEDGAFASLLGPALYAITFSTGILASKRELFGFADKFAYFLADKALKWTEQQEEPQCLMQGLALEWMDKQKLRNEILDFFIVAPGTVSMMLSFAIFHFSNHSDKWEQLRRDVLAVGNSSLDEATLSNISYLQLVLDEVSRLHPITCFGSRVAKHDTYLPVGEGGVVEPMFVPKGTRLSANILAMHCDASVFGSNPEEFRPERWTEIKRPGIWQFMPFSRGPRACQGKYKARLEFKYLLARMAQEIKDIRPAKPRDCALTHKGRPSVCPVAVVKVR